MSELKVGDEVWVRGRVHSNDGSECFISVGDGGSHLGEYTDEVVSSHPDDIRSADDFKDPLDDAIVEAAIEWQSDHGDKPMYSSSLSRLWRAVQDKLDADKLKTVDEVLAEHALWVHVKEDQQPSKCACGHEFKLGESFVRHQSDALREASLLKE